MCFYICLIKWHWGKTKNPDLYVPNTGYCIDSMGMRPWLPASIESILCRAPWNPTQSPTPETLFFTRNLLLLPSAVGKGGWCTGSLFIFPHPTWLCLELEGGGGRFDLEAQKDFTSVATIGQVSTNPLFHASILLHSAHLHCDSRLPERVWSPSQCQAGLGPKVIFR